MHKLGPELDGPRRQAVGGAHAAAEHGAGLQQHDIGVGGGQGVGGAKAGHPPAHDGDADGGHGGWRCAGAAGRRARRGVPAEAGGREAAGVGLSTEMCSP